VNAKIIFATVWIAILAGALPAPAQVIGDWVVDVTSQNAYSAVTVNDSGHGFGQFCDLNEGNCYWLIETSSSCAVGTTSPVLGNSDGTAVNLELLCIGQLEGGNSAYVFTNFDQVDELVRHSDRVGFALPLGDDEFRMEKYNVRGTVDALTVMLAATNKRLKSIPNNNRRNRVFSAIPRNNIANTSPVLSIRHARSEFGATVGGSVVSSSFVADERFASVSG
jgi:hypothetical protein